MPLKRFIAEHYEGWVFHWVSPRRDGASYEVYVYPDVDYMMVCMGSVQVTGRLPGDQRERHPLGQQCCRSRGTALLPGVRRLPFVERRIRMISAHDDTHRTTG